MQNGRNALLTLILPLALQNAMLFEATIGMTRAAWLLRRGSEPLEDKMLLRHKGATLLHLRNALEGGRQSRSDLVLLTMSTLLTFNVRCPVEVGEAPADTSLVHDRRRGVV